MKYIVPAVINKNYTIPTIQNNFGREIEIVLTHIWDDLVEKLGIDDRDVCYGFDNNPRGALATAIHIEEDKETNEPEFYAILLCPNSINTFTLQNSDANHMVNIIINTIAHEFRHIWQFKNKAYEFMDIYSDEYSKVYHELPYEIDANEFANQYEPSQKILCDIMCDIVQDRVYNNYNLSFFVNIHDFLTRGLSVKGDTIPIIFSGSNDNIQYVQFIYHYDNETRFEVLYNSMLIVHYNPCIFDFNSLVDRSLESIAVYIGDILLSMAHEYNGLDYTDELKISLYEIIRLRFMMYIYTRK